MSRFEVKSVLRVVEPNHPTTVFYGGKYVELDGKNTKVVLEYGTIVIKRPDGSRDQIENIRNMEITYPGFKMLRKDPEWPSFTELLIKGD